MSKENTMWKLMLCCLAGVCALGLGVSLADDAVPSSETVKPAAEKAQDAKPADAASETTPGDSAPAKTDEATKPDSKSKRAEAKTKASKKQSYGGGRFAAEPAFQDDFLPGWEKTQKDWNVATWMQNTTQMSPERCATDGKGVMVQTVLAGEPHRGGSMETKKEYGYGRWVGRIKPAAVAGALNSFFTIDWDNHATAEKNDGTKFEIDIEFVTASFGPNKGQVEFAVHHFGDKKGLGKVVDLDFNPSDDYHIWGFDILPEGIVWHVDGRVLHEYKCPPGETVPDIGHEFFMNSWTQVKWVRGPTKADAKYYIDWVRFYPLAKK